MTSPDPDVGQLAELVSALQRKCAYLSDRIDNLEEQNEELSQRLAKYENVVDPDPGSVEYEQLTRPQKVHRIRKKLATLATNSNGRASMRYGDVKAHFDGLPSDGHCYTLMERAAELDGFAYDRAGSSGEGEWRLRVKIDDVNDEALLHAVNNARTEEAL